MNRRFTLAICVSVAIHALLLTWMSRWNALHGPAADETPLFVFLGQPGPAGGSGGAASGSGASGSSAFAPQPDSEESRGRLIESLPDERVEPLVANREPAQVAPSAKPRPAVRAPDADDPSIEAQRAAPTQPSGERVSGAASAASPIEGGGGIGARGAGNGGPGGAGGTAAYEQVIAAWLDRHKYYPSSLRRRGIEGEGKLRIRISRFGRLLDVTVADSFSHPALEATSREWVRRAQPFPPVPDTLAGDDFVFVVPIGFRLR